MTSSTLASRLAFLPSLPTPAAVWPHVLGTLLCSGTALWLHALMLMVYGQMVGSQHLRPDAFTSLLEALDASWRGLALLGLAWSVWAVRERPRWRVMLLLLLSAPLALAALVMGR